MLEFVNIISISLNMYGKKAALRKSGFEKG